MAEVFSWRVEFVVEDELGGIAPFVVVVDAESNYLAIGKAGIQAGHSFGINPDSVMDVKAIPDGPSRVV